MDAAGSSPSGWRTSASWQAGWPHDFNNLLAVISNYAGLVSAELAKVARR